LAEISCVAAIVREVTDFAHMGTGASELQDVNSLLDSAVHLATLHLGDSASVERRYAQLPSVTCSGQELRQIFLNILLNATRAEGDEARIRLRTEHRDDEVVVAIEHDGWTIAPILVERGFDPAFDGESTMGASGLGLSLSYQMLRQLGGDLEVNTGPRGGARVSVHLPIGGGGGGDDQAWGVAPAR
jgi:C4-dicarboxylate-specific signal transduction histidine kinase